MEADALEPAVSALLAQAAQHHTTGDWATAVTLYGQVLDQVPTLVEALVQRGLLLQELGQIDAARRDFDEALRLDPAYGLAYYGRGWVRHAQGDFAGELDDAQRGLSLDPAREGLYRLRLGAAYHGLGHYDEALTAYNRAAELNPETEGIYYNRGGCYEDMKAYPAALADYNRALAADPEWSWALAARGRLYLKMNEPERARADLDAALAGGMQEPPVYFYRGLAARELGRDEAARADFRRVVALTRHPELRHQAAQQLEELGGGGRMGLLGLLTLQPAAYRQLANDPGETGKALLLVLAVTIIIVGLPLLLPLPSSDIDRLRARLISQMHLTPEVATGAVRLIGLALPLLWLLQVGIIGGLARLMGHPSRIGALVRTTGYASVFSLLSIVPLPLANLLGSIVGIAAYVIAIQAALRVSPTRALGLGCAGLGGAGVGMIVFTLVVLAALGGR